MSFRLDYGRLDGAQRTPSGGLKIPAFVTRTGVFAYKTDQGTIVRELRHPDHVFSKESLDSMEDATNAVGHVRNVEASGKFVAARAVVQDAAAIKGVEDGSLVEVSCGYSCDVVNTPGTYEGETYDSVQTNIRYNHVALGPRGWGRAGSSVALRLDSGDAIQETTVTDVQPVPPTQETPAMLVTINGKPYTVGTPEHIQALGDFATAETKRADAAEAAVKVAEAKASEATGRADAATTALTAANDPAAVTAKVNARLALQATASKILGADFKFDGKSDHEIMVAAIVKTDAEFKADGKDEGYILGRFSGCQAPRQDAVAVVRAAAKTAIATDATPPKTYEQKRADAQAEAANAWTQPLAVSKK